LLTAHRQRLQPREREVPPVIEDGYRDFDFAGQRPGCGLLRLRDLTTPAPGVIVRQLEAIATGLSGAPDKTN